VPDADGPIEAHVRDVTFQGSRTSLELAIDGAPTLAAEVASAGAPQRGDGIRVRIDPAAVVALAPRSGSSEQGQ
jgi:hypothetical protein